MKTKILVVLFFVFCTVCDNNNPISNQEQVSSDLIPLVTGSSWKLTNNNNSIKTVTFTVAGDTVWKGSTYTIIAETYGSSAEPYLYFVRVETPNRFVLVEGGSRVWTLDASKQDGQSYTDGSYSITVKHLDSVTTDAGTFQNCIDFYIDAPAMADDETGFVFAPGVGLVRKYDAWIQPYSLVSYQLK